MTPGNRSPRVEPKHQRARIFRTALGVALMAAGVAVFFKAPENAEKVAIVLIVLGGIITEPSLLLQAGSIKVRSTRERAE